MKVKGNRGMLHLIKAIGNSVNGLTTALKNEAAFRQESVLTVMMIPAAFWLGTTSIERALLIGSWMIVLITELLNSALETAVDRIGLDHHILSKQAKDMGSAAVLVSLVTAGMVWGLILYERFIP
jgi:diacylglycerol kinase (ATP)